MNIDAASQVISITSTDRLGMTLFLAAAVHGIVILGVGFGDVNRGRAPHSSLDVVLVQTPSQMAPAQADNIAQSNSQASGSVHAAPRPSTPALGAVVTPPEDQTFAASPSASPEPRLVTRMLARTAVSQVRQQRPREPRKDGEAQAREQTELERLSVQL